MCSSWSLIFHIWRSLQTTIRLELKKQTHLFVFTSTDFQYSLRSVFVVVSGPFQFSQFPISSRQIVFTPSDWFCSCSPVSKTINNVSGPINSSTHCLILYSLSVCILSMKWHEILYKITFTFPFCSLTTQKGSQRNSSFICFTFLFWSYHKSESVSKKEKHKTVYSVAFCLSVYFMVQIQKMNCKLGRPDKKKKKQMEQNDTKLKQFQIFVFFSQSLSRLFITFAQLFFCFYLRHSTISGCYCSSGSNGSGIVLFHR